MIALVITFACLGSLALGISIGFLIRKKLLRW